MPNSPRAPIWPSGCRCWPTRRAVWSANSRMRMKLRSRVRCCAARPSSTKRCWSKSPALKGQGHLLAMAERPALSPDLTDVIVRRGDRDVVRRTAGNAGAAFSSDGYSTLIKRAGQDGVLTIRIGQRDDLSADAIEGSALRLDRRRPPPPVRGRQARAAGRDQAGDERDHPARPSGPRAARLRAGAAHGAGAAPRRRARRRRAAQFCQGFQIRGIGRRAVGDDRREDRNPRSPDHAATATIRS